MIGINKGPIVTDLETIFVRVLAEPVPKAIGRGEMVAAIVQNPLINPDGSANPLALLIGSGSNQAYYMLPGQESPLIYAEDQKDIYIRAFNLNLQGGVVTLFGLLAGAGYTVGDVVTLTGGDGNAEITVTQIGGGGSLFDWDITNAGTGYAVGEITEVTGGTGAGARFRVDAILGSVQIPIFIYRLRKGGKQ